MLNVRERRALQKLDEVRSLVDIIGPGFASQALNVHRTTLTRWMKGTIKPPDSALAIMRQLAGFGFDGWPGWGFRAGRLYSPAGQSWSPGDVMAQQYERALIKALQLEVVVLREKLARASTGHPAANDGDLSVRLEAAPNR